MTKKTSDKKPGSLASAKTGKTKISASKKQPKPWSAALVAALEAVEHAGPSNGRRRKT